MKFINKITGVIVEPKTDFVIEQLKNNTDYKEYKEVKKTEIVKETKEKNNK